MAWHDVVPRRDRQRRGCPPTILPRRHRRASRSLFQRQLRGTPYAWRLAGGGVVAIGVSGVADRGVDIWVAWRWLVAPAWRDGGWGVWDWSELFRGHGGVSLFVAWWGFGVSFLLAVAENKPCCESDNGDAADDAWDEDGGAFGGGGEGSDSGGRVGVFRGAGDGGGGACWRAKGWGDGAPEEGAYVGKVEVAFGGCFYLRVSFRAGWG